MARVLMGWELGGGLGHVARLLPIARELRQAGHQPWFVVKRPESASLLFEGDEFPVSQAPPFPAFRSMDANDTFRAETYADILRVHGFADHDALANGLAAWDRVFCELRPSLIVCDHAPRLCLAAMRKIPVVHVGTGFTCPPVSDTWFPPIPSDAPVITDQTELLQVVRDVQRQRGGFLPERLTDVLSHAEEFVTVWRELDPYRTVRERGTAGPLHRIPDTDYESADSGDVEFFAYLSGSMPGIEQVVLALLKSGLRGRTFLRDATPDQTRRLQQAGARLEIRPVPLDAVLPTTPLVVHHGGIGLTEAGIAAGCPQLLLPGFLEQKLTGDCLEAMQAGRSFHGTVRLSSVIAAAGELLNPETRQRSKQLALNLRDRYPESAIVPVMNVCLRLLRWAIN
ncbi:MAG: hypothetical protein R3C19_12615 [Planctomycetaceae bacterium]